MVSHHRHGSLAGSANGDERPRSRDYYSARRRSRRPRSRSISPEADRSSVRSGGRGAGPSRRDYGSPRVRDLYASEYLRHDELYRERSPPPSREPPRDLTLAPWQSTTTYPEYESRSVMCLHVAPQATVRDLGEFFENRLGQGVVLDVAIAKSKEEEQILGGFVELSQATLVPKALGLTGHLFFGVPIRIEPTEAARLATFRRSDMFINPGAQTDSIKDAPSLPAPVPGASLPLTVPPRPQDVSGNGGPVAMGGTSYNTLARLYAGSLAYEATAPEVKIVFDRYGEVEYVDLHRETDTGKSKGFCFVQYKDPESANLALANLNGYELRGRAMKVRRATARGTGSRPGMPAFGDAHGQMQYHGQAPAAGYQRPPYAPVRDEGGLAVGGGDAMAAPSEPEAPTVLLKHMFDPAEETEPDWDLEMARDVQQECESQYGPVNQIFVDSHSHGDIYVKFVDHASAVRAVSGLNGRLFGGNTILAQHIPMATFAAHVR